MRYGEGKEKEKRSGKRIEDEGEEKYKRRGTEWEGKSDDWLIDTLFILWIKIIKHIQIHKIKDKPLSKERI